MEGMCLVCGRYSLKLLARLCEAVEKVWRNESFLQTRSGQVADVSHVALYF
jgi:hypothetical protein